MLINDHQYVLIAEMQFFYHLHDEEDSFIAFYPQTSIKISDSLKVQIGMGLYCKKSKIVPQFVHKVILMTPHKKQ